MYVVCVAVLKIPSVKKFFGLPDLTAAAAATGVGGVQLTPGTPVQTFTSSPRKHRKAGPRKAVPGKAEI